MLALEIPLVVHLIYYIEAALGSLYFFAVLSEICIFVIREGGRKREKMPKGTIKRTRTSLIKQNE